jgi:hypothetical protein
LCLRQRISKLWASTGASDDDCAIESVFESLTARHERSGCTKCVSGGARIVHARQHDFETGNTFYDDALESLAVRRCEQPVTVTKMQVNRTLGNSSSLHEVFKPETRLAMLLQQFDRDLNGLFEVRGSTRRSLTGSRFEFFRGGERRFSLVRALLARHDSQAIRTAQ